MFTLKRIKTYSAFIRDNYLKSKCYPILFDYIGFFQYSYIKHNLTLCVVVCNLQIFNECKFTQVHMPARSQHIGALGVCRSIAIYGIAGTSGVGVVGTLKCWFLEGQISECGWNETKTIAWGSIGLKFWVPHALGIPGKVFPPPWVSDLDMNHGTCVAHVPWCKPGSLTSGFLWSSWRG